MGYALFVVFVGNLGAITDLILHPEIPYFDVEHLVVGGVNALAVACLLSFLEVSRLRRRRAEREIEEREVQFRALFENMPAGLAITAGNEVLLANRALLQMVGRTAEEFRREPLITSIAPVSHELFRERLARFESGAELSPSCEYAVVSTDGTLRTVHAMSARITWQGRPCRQLTFVDITQRKQAEADLIAANEQLIAASKKIKSLHGLLPICCGCKKIRDDHKYWHEVDRYLAEHSDVTFTHGFCPECARKYYPELDHSYH